MDAVLTRRRPLAILAILAAAGPSGVSRDRIITLLWPEVDEERGRNVLNQTFFSLRRELRQPEVVLGRTELRLNPEVIDSDVAQFDEAIARRDFNLAVQLYTGAFLDGFHLSEAEFERWVDEQRARLARRAVTAFTAVAEAAERAGDLSRAVDARWRVVDADPLDSRATLALVRTLAASGDRAKAVQVARRHETLLRQEVGAAVDREIVRFIEELLGDSGVLPPVHSGEPTVTLVTHDEPRSRTPNLTEGIVPAPGRRKRIGAALAVLALSVAPALWFARDRVNTSSDVVNRVTTVAVLPFVVQGSDDFAYLRDAVPELLGRGIDGVGSIRTVDAATVRRTLAKHPVESAGATVGERLKAGGFVDGRVVVTATSIRITATVTQRGRGRDALTTISVDGSPSDPLRLIDQLTSRVLLALRPSGRFKPTDVGMLITRSPAALRAFIDAESRRNVGEYPAAIEAYQIALREDSTFALAWYGLSNAADWASRGDLVLPAARQAERFGGHLSEHDRLLTRAYLAWREGRSQDAERWYRILLHAYPDDAEAWYQFGDLLFHDNSRRGRSFVEAREPFRRVLALNPDEHETLSHALRIAARLGAVDEVDSLTRKLLSLSRAEDAASLHAFRAYAVGDTAAQREAMPALINADATVLSVLAWRVSIFSGDLAGAERILRLGMRADRPLALQNAVRAPLGYVLMGRGQYAAAFEEALRLERTTGLQESASMGMRIHVLLAPDAPVRRDLIEQARHRADTLYNANLARGTLADSTAAYESLCARAMFDAALGRIALASQADSLLRNSPADPIGRRLHNDCADVVRARVEFGRGRADRAARILLAQRAERVPEGAVEVSGRFLLAESLHALGRDREAAGWYASICERGLDELAYYAAAERRLGAIAQRAEDFTAAAEHYRRVLRIWESSDPELRPLLDDVRRQLLAVEAALRNGKTGSR